jgi:peptide/nickel transport system substrate-binding protein
MFTKFKEQKEVFMQERWSIIVVYCMLALSFFSFTGPALSLASPEGEITIAVEYMGNQVPIPYIEMSQGLDYQKLLFDPLVGTTPDGRSSPEQGVAYKWEMSPDALTWTFYLRKGVKFHDGVELTAKDVKFSIEQAMRADATQVAATAIKKVLKGIEVKDPYSLVVHCKEPSPFFDSLVNDSDGCIGLIMPKDYYEKGGKDQFQKRPVGSGPYKFHSQVLGSEMRLEATDRHWRDGVPRYKSVRFRIIPEESTRVAMLRAGEADIIPVSRAKLNEIQKAGFKVLSKKDAAMVVFTPMMQWTSPAFSDIRFRKALNLAIDKEAIMKHIFGGWARPVTAYPGSTIMVCGKVPDLKPYPYDPEEAKRLIKDGGFLGYEFSVPSYNRPGCPEFRDLVEAVCGYWEKIGLKPKIFMTDWSVYQERWRSGTSQGTVYGTNSMWTPSIPSQLVRMRDRAHSKFKPTAIRDPKVDEMFDKASNSLDPAEVGRLLVDIHLYHYEKYHFIPICHINEEVATTKRIPEWDLGMRRTDRNYNELIRQR